MPDHLGKELLFARLNGRNAAGTLNMLVPDVPPPDMTHGRPPCSWARAFKETPYPYSATGTAQAESPWNADPQQADGHG